MPKFVKVIRNSVLTSKKTTRLRYKDKAINIVYKEIIALYSENNTKCKVTEC